MVDPSLAAGLPAVELPRFDKNRTTG